MLKFTLISVRENLGKFKPGGYDRMTLVDIMGWDVREVIMGCSGY